MKERVYFRAKSLFVTLSLIILTAGSGKTQILHPSGGFVFGDESVPRIDLSMDPADIQSLYEDKYSDTEYPADFKFTRETVSEVLGNVGVRFRGNTSRDKQKMSFRVSFNSFEEEGREFHELEKLNLNAETNDPSMIRSKLSWNLFRKFGVAASRSNHVLLYINGDFYGVYINTEHVDECFARSRFDENHGNLYKCLWPADLHYRGSDGDDYKHENSWNGERPYSLRINQEWDDYDDLGDMITRLDKNMGNELMEELEEVFNVQQYLKTMAVDVMTGNWDGYMGNKNNFYLYRDPVSGRVNYIPYDLDNTWGIDYLGVDWGSQPIYAWNLEWLPLCVKLLEVELYQDQYSYYIRELAAYMVSPELRAEVDRWQAQISAWVAQDSWYSLDNGFTHTDFLNSLDQAWNSGNDQVKYGVFEYASLRAQSALVQVNQNKASPLVTAFEARPLEGEIEVEWTVHAPEGISSSSLYYSYDRGPWQSIPLGPLSTDVLSGELRYLGLVPVSMEEVRVELYVEVIDTQSGTTVLPLKHYVAEYPMDHGPLYINEFVTSNSSGKKDQDGDYDDWLEVYNASESTIWMGDKFLSDSRGNPAKYRFPKKNLAPGEFLLVWCDGQEPDPEDPYRYQWHAPFRLRASGEHIRLSDAASTGFAPFDSLSYGEQTTDIAYGRSTDGGPDWIFFPSPTPGYSNLSVGLDDRDKDQNEGREDAELKAWPVPVHDGTLYFSREVSGRVFSLSGRMVKEITKSSWMDVSSMQPGIYLFRSFEGEQLRFIVEQ